MKSFCAKLFTLIILASLSAFALAQSSGAIQSQAPLTRDLTVLQTLSSQTSATVTSSDQSGFNMSRLTCVFRLASSTGTPSIVFSVQGKDAPSGQYYTLLSSAAVTGTSTNPIHVGAGVTTTSNVSAGLPIPRVWRTSLAVAGSSPVVTGTVGCSVQ